MKKILFVEDDSALLDLYSFFLRGNFEVFVASNSESAIERFLKTKIDIIVTDIWINGGMNGYKFSERIRLINPTTPILAITDFDNLDEEKSSVFFKILKKPVKKQELIRELINL